VTNLDYNASISRQHHTIHLLSWSVPAVQKRIKDVVEAYSAVMGLLESPVMTVSHQRRLELMRDNLEREMASLKAEQPTPDMAAD
jgi:hypothetical protein